MATQLKSQDRWEEILADVESGKRADFTPLGPTRPSFKDWLAQQGDRYDPANYQSRTSYSDEEWGEEKVGLSALGRQRGATTNPAEYDYLKQFYNVPSYKRGFIEGIAPIVSAAAIPVAGAAGWLGGGAAAGEAVGFEGFVDPWEVMGDPAAYGLGGGEAAAAGGAAATGAETVSSTPGAASQGATVAEAASPYNAGAGAFDAAGVGVTNADKAIAGAYAPESSGLIGSILKWGHDNPLIASTALSVGGGMLKGAFAPTPEEQANAVADAQIKRDQAQLSARQNANNLGAVNVSRLKPTGVRLPRPGLIQSRM